MMDALDIAITGHSQATSFVTVFKLRESLTKSLYILPCMIQINIPNVKLLCLMSGALNSHIIELVVIFQICTSNCWGLRQIAEISLNFTPICVKSWEGRWEGEC